MDDLHRRLEQLCSTKQSQGNDVKEDPEWRPLLHSLCVYACKDSI